VREGIRRYLTERADEGDAGIGGAGPMELSATCGTWHYRLQRRS